MGMRGQAPVGTTLWGETWTGGDANETPSAYGFEGTTVYGGATLTYAQSSTNIKLYEEALAGGESPELLLSKSNQTWTISNIPTGQATGMALTFKSNKTTFDVTSTTTGILLVVPKRVGRLPQQVPLLLLILRLRILVLQMLVLMTLC
jgi:hypothetical protein